MKIRASFVVLAAGLVVAAPALACGESMFNTGRGLEYQGYLAPRPATVLIYGTPDKTANEQQRQALLKGLEGAGHRVVVAADADAYAQALRAQKVDLVIADSASIEAMAPVDGVAAPQVLPVVAKREARGSRHALSIRDGASLGQYLRAIDRAVAAAATP